MPTDNSIINAPLAVVVCYLKQLLKIKKIIMKKLLAISFIGMVLFTACKKDPAVEEVSLTGKWNVETIVTKGYENSALISTDTEPGNGFKYDFQTNGTLLISSFLNGVTYPYSILPNSKVQIDSDIFEIRNLTASQVTLFIREDYAPGEYDELFINLKR